LIQRTRVLRTFSLDPYHNLALEEYLLNEVAALAAAGCQATLYLWQNENTVVIGKNQNPWRECSLEQLEAEGGKLARRLSGGGAVFHDLGNLNFTFLLPRADYDLNRQARVILNAVRSVGVPAEMSGRNDLEASGRKFSGNAFCLRKEGAFHHGTILINADFQKMTRYLQPSAEKLRAKGVESVRARVVNLSELSPGLGVVQFAKALELAFCNEYGKGPSLTEEQIVPQGHLDSLREKYASWAWRIGRTPRFDVDWAHRFPWGEVEIGLSLKDGFIAEAAVYSDAMQEAFIEAVRSALPGCPYQGSALSQRIRRLEVGEDSQTLQSDLVIWLESLKQQLLQ